MASFIRSGSAILRHLVMCDQTFLGRTLHLFLDYYVLWNKLTKLLCLVCFDKTVYSGGKSFSGWPPCVGYFHKFS